MQRFPVVAPAASVICAAVLSVASGFAADWLTDGGDTRRTNWQQDEKIITKTNVKDLKLIWKVKLDNKPRQMHSLLEPLIIGSVNTAIGPKQLVIQAGVSDNLYALDADTGQIVWKRHFDSNYEDPPGQIGRASCRERVEM